MDSSESHEAEEPFNIECKVEVKIGEEEFDPDLVKLEPVDDNELNSEKASVPEKRSSMSGNIQRKTQRGKSKYIDRRNARKGLAASKITIYRIAGMNRKGGYSASTPDAKFIYMNDIPTSCFLVVPCAVA